MIRELCGVLLLLLFFSVGVDVGGTLRSSGDRFYSKSTAFKKRWLLLDFYSFPERVAASSAITRTRELLFAAGLILYTVREREGQRPTPPLVHWLLQSHVCCSFCFVNSLELYRVAVF